MTGEPWYEAAFRGDYLNVYAHRDDESARAEAAFAARALHLSPHSRVLDLACGAGRRARALAAAGHRVVGIDLSADLLAAAVAAGGGVRGFVRGDMRAIPLRGPFDAVTMFFTSFGYFDEAGNDRVLAEVSRVLSPGGRILLDVPNRDVVVAGLVPESEREGEGGSVIRERRHMTPDGRRVTKEVRIFRGEKLAAEYTESVRLYAPAELAARLARAGLPEEARYGDLAGLPFGAESARLVLVGRRAS